MPKSILGIVLYANVSESHRNTGWLKDIFASNTK